MTTEELIELETVAGEHFARFRSATYPDRVVLVVSIDVLATLVEQGLIYSARSGDGYHPTYHGYRIAVIKEPRAVRIMRPALWGISDYYDWMDTNDFIIDENHLFALENTYGFPFCADMHLTISFLEGFSAESEATTNTEVHRLAGITADGDRFELQLDMADQFEPVMNERVSDAFAQLADAVERFDSSVELLKGVVSLTDDFNKFAESYTEEKSKWDTEVIDEFLSGFHIKQAEEPRA